MNGRRHREGWYELIKPRIFIEENLNVQSDDQITEYYTHVFNYKALFCVVYLPNIDKSLNYRDYILNLYMLPEFVPLNVSWGVHNNKTYEISIHSQENLNTMILFAQHFSQKERFHYVRVDFYEINNKIYFSEFTYATWSAIGLILPVSFDYLLYNFLCDNNQTYIDEMYQYSG